MTTTDHLGSPRVITDQNGAVTNRKDYTAFGEVNYTSQRVTTLGYDASAEETRKGYTGYEKDAESGLDFAQARYYNAVHGRFTSSDPLTASASIRNPQTFNRYSYVLNSPYKYTDPLGLIPEEPKVPGQIEKDCTKGCAIDGKWYEPVDFQTSPPPEPPPNPDTAQNSTSTPADGQPWVVSNISALENEVAKGMEGLKSCETCRTECAALPQLWDLRKGKIPVTVTNDWIMGDKVVPGLNLQRGTVLATFDREAGAYNSEPTGNHVVIFLEWVKESTRDKVEITNTGVTHKISGSTTYYAKVIEQGPSFKPQVSLIQYSESPFAINYRTNIWYYNVVNKPKKR